MALYKIEITKSVRIKDLVRIPKKVVIRIVGRITKLSVNPYPIDAVQLKGREEWRIRQGDNRILYLVQEKIVTIFVVKVGHRKEIYRR